jgi:ribonuclease P protein component
MIKKNYRFHSRGGVRYTYQNGKTIRGSKISLVFADNSRNKQRYAIVVSKKILKSAVGRNRIRRRSYEALRALLPNIQKPVDCIFIVNSKDILDIDFKELRHLIHNLLIEASII